MISMATVCQNTCKGWHELRYGRITASVLYKTAQCTTTCGSLVEKILSANDFDTPDMKRGRDLEKLVLQKVSNTLKKTLNKPGLLLNANYSYFGASPDSVTADKVVGVKCPKNDKNINHYYRDGKIVRKYKAQIQL